MAEKNLDHFLEHLELSESLQTLFRELALGEKEALRLSAEDLVRMGQQRGYSFTAEDVRAKKKALSDDELEKVAGGRLKHVEDR